MTDDGQGKETRRPETAAEPDPQTQTTGSVDRKESIRRTRKRVTPKSRNTAWRTAHRLGPALVAAVLAVGQLVLLHRQSDLMEAQTRAEAADKYVFFLTQEETALRLLGAAFDHRIALDDMDLGRRSSISPAELRQRVLEAKPNDVLVREIIEKCGLSLYPVGQPVASADKAIEDLDTDYLLGAKLAAGELREWMKRATDRCKERLDLMRELRKRMQTAADFDPARPALDGAARPGSRSAQ